MTFKVDESKLEDLIPSRMHGAIVRYLEEGIPPGGFLQAIIANDLKGAVGRADSENITRIGDYVTFFYNYAPSTSWGSQEKMDSWLASFQEKEAENTG